MNVAESVGRTLAELGLRQAFGVVGSGNFHVTNAFVRAGGSYIAARHEGGAATMADAYTRLSDEQMAILTVHQGPGLTNAVTGIAEAAKSRTPLLVLAPETTAPRSNFYVDQSSLAAAVGAESVRVTSAETALKETVHAYTLARDQRRTVVLQLPLEIQSAPVSGTAPAPQLSVHASEGSGAATNPDVAELVDLLARAGRPVILGGRGARHARGELIDLADACGALLATSAVAKGLFVGSQWSLDVSGGFASPLAADLIRNADVLVAFGCALNMWTTRHGTLIGPDTTLVQVDIDADAIGRHRDVALGVVGDSAVIADAAASALLERSDGTLGYRADPAIRHRLQRELHWRDLPYDDWGTGSGPDARIDPRTLTIGLDDILPVERVVGVDSGNFMGYPTMFLSVPDQNGFCFTQAFQAVGLGLATAIGAAVAQPDRFPVAALGDGGALMAASELDTVRRLGLPMAVVVYNDSAYGAEVHHFTDGEPLDTVTFPETDVAAIGAGYGFESVTVRTPGDLAAVQHWVDGPQDAPLLIDAKVAAPRGSWWLEEAFRGH